MSSKGNFKQCNHKTKFGNKLCTGCGKQTSIDSGKTMCYDCSYPEKQCKKCTKISRSIVKDLCDDCRNPRAKCLGCHNNYYSNGYVNGKCTDCVDTICVRCKKTFRNEQIKNGKCYDCVDTKCIRCKRTFMRSEINFMNRKCSECHNCPKIECTECGIKYDSEDIVKGTCVKCIGPAKEGIIRTQKEFEDLVDRKIQEVCSKQADCSIESRLRLGTICAYERLKEANFDDIVANSKKKCGIGDYKNYTWQGVIRHILGADLPNNDYIGGGSTSSSLTA